MGMNDCCPIHILNYPLPSIEKHFLKHGATYINIQGALHNTCTRKKGLAVVMPGLIDFVNMFVVECLPSCAFLKVFQAIL